MSKYIPGNQKHLSLEGSSAHSFIRYAYQTNGNWKISESYFF